VGFAGYQLNFGYAGKQLNEKFFETAILNEIAHSGNNNADLYGMLGDLYFGRDNYAQAVAAYRNALKLDPNNATVLNNYAWLLATCKDPAFRDPKLALKLARKAAALDSSPHVLDTLAESQYVNGRIAAAVSTATAALKAAQKNRDYYRGQLEKFRGGGSK
jgi:cytochrome c-type biogenesis protein CcmH/NrfG